MHEELSPKGLTVIAVALDSRGNEAAGPCIDVAKPTFPCLVDREHRVAELYDIINVPSAVWIDEVGHMVRPVEPAGMSDAVVKAMTATYQAEQLGADESRRLETWKKTREPQGEGEQPVENPVGASRAMLWEARKSYCDALRDWVEKGDASEYALSEEEVLGRMQLPGEQAAEANAYFRLGVYLHTQGQASEAEWALDRAVELRPESIAILRQFGDLEAPGSMGGERFFRFMQSRDTPPFHGPTDIPTSS